MIGREEMKEEARRIEEGSREERGKNGKEMANSGAHRHPGVV